MTGADFMAYADARFAASVCFVHNDTVGVRDAYRAGCLSEVLALMFRYLPDEAKADFRKRLETPPCR